MCYIKAFCSAHFRPSFSWFWRCGVAPGGFGNRLIHCQIGESPHVPRHSSWGCRYQRMRRACDWWCLDRSYELAYVSRSYPKILLIANGPLGWCFWMYGQCNFDDCSLLLLTLIEMYLSAVAFLSSSGCLSISLLM